MWKIRTILSPQKVLLIIPCLILFLVYFKLVEVPQPSKSTESLVNQKLRQLKEHDLLPKLSKPKTIEILQKSPAVPPAVLPSCPNVLTNMVQGYWKQNSMTPDQRKEIDHFLNVLARYEAVPPNFQRTDLKCGNVTYPLPYNKWIRAVCDKHGATPCCYNNKCVSMTSDECICDNCLDLRTRIIAEYADWIPFDRRCTVKVYNQNDACELLSDHVMVFMGDSMVVSISLCCYC
ncbi:hypothetical protein LOTGIDRAFT_170762 [Lottia gigantea]|uniref:Uncharacterized protein n=1 Tax=Lottia gigantea TaxID=225164 RepID=V4BFA5_LOTGI|nr:hypothetical protein LOTGIDRAFT_170762 [Lottia gigantea]ESP04517.1 hypothetical protein LOTGIDRAFT_170762 [Lottia gigantea]